MTPWRVPYPKFGNGPGLARVLAIAGRLGVDLAAFGARAAVVVGSNGKGSTAAMTESLLLQTGAAVGLFTSPHLFDLNERFRLEGQDISDEDLQTHWRRVADAIDAYQRDTGDQVGGFEFLFLIAADWFKARSADFTVWEAGIGGRFDPVRLIEAPQLALTSLDLEHTELLGDTLEAIARDKLDAAPKGAKVFAPSDIPVRDVVQAACSANGVRFETIAPLSYRQVLPGNHQRQNAALALALAREAASLSDAQVRLGLSLVRWPGRLETIGIDPPVVIDVGHTPRGIEVARAGFFESVRGDRPAILVCGASQDKDSAKIIALLAPGFDFVVCARARHKGAPAGQIAAYAQAANPGAEVAIAESVEDAHRLALARAGAVDGVVYVAGGLFLAAEFKAVHVGRDPTALAFF